MISGPGFSDFQWSSVTCSHGGLNLERLRFQQLKFSIPACAQPCLPLFFKGTVRTSEVLLAQGDSA